MATAATKTQFPNPALETPVIYKVKPGDTASHIVQAYYGAVYGSPRFQQATRYLQLYNPQIENLDKIRAGQALRLMPLESQSGISYCPAPDEHLAQLDSSQQPQPTPYDLRPAHQTMNRYETGWPESPAEESAFWALAMLQENYNWLSISAGTALGTLGNLTSHGNNQLLQQVRTTYEQYKRGMITKGQYDASRRRALKQYAQMVGPFEKFLMGGKTTQESIRISRVRGLPATHRIESQLHRLRRLSGLAVKGGVVLTAGGLYVGCQNISAANNRSEKNEIFVETVASAFAGVGSMAITAVLLSNPIGWGVALVLAAGTAATSWGVGYAAREAYTRYGDKVDFVSALNIDQICR